MDAKTKKDPRLEGGIWTTLSPWQWALIAFATPIAVLVSYAYSAWFTLAGPIVGMAVALGIHFLAETEFVGNFFAAIYRKIRPPIRATVLWSGRIYALMFHGKEPVPDKQSHFLKRSKGLESIDRDPDAPHVAELKLDRASEFNLALTEMIELKEYCSKLIKSEMPETALDARVSLATRVPARYIRWALMGLFMMVMGTFGFTRDYYSTVSTQASPAQTEDAAKAGAIEKVPSPSAAIPASDEVKSEDAPAETKPAADAKPKRKSKATAQKRTPASETGTRKFSQVSPPWWETSWLLDFVFGMLAMMIVIELTESDNGRDATSEIRDALTELLRRRLLGVQKIGHLSEAESADDLARLARALRQQAIAQLDGSFRLVQEHTIMILVLFVVVGWCWWKPALLVVVATVPTLHVMFQDCLAIRRGEAKIAALIMERSGLVTLAEDSRLSYALRTIAGENALTDSISLLTEQIMKVRTEARNANRAQKRVARIIFVTLYGLAAYAVWDATYHHEMGTRRAFLFWVSMGPIFTSITMISENLSKIFGVLRPKLEEVRELVEVLELDKAIKAADGLSDAERLALGLPPRVEIIRPDCLQLSLSDLNHNYPGSKTSLRTEHINAEPLNIPFSSSQYETVAIIGSTGKSQLAQLLTGELEPSSGGIYFGSKLANRASLRSAIVRIPDKIPQLSGKLVSLFQHICCYGLTPEDPEELADFLNRLEIDAKKAFSDVGLLEEIEFPGLEDSSGIHTVVGPGHYLNEEQNRLAVIGILLWRMRQRFKAKDSNFHPHMIVLDGIHHFKCQKRRLQIINLFQTFLRTQEIHATLVVTLDDPRDLQGDWHVLTISGPEDLTASQIDRMETEFADLPREKWPRLVEGGRLHKEFGTLEVDGPTKTRYQAFTARLRKAIAT